MSGEHVTVLDKGSYLLVTCPPCHAADTLIACIDGICDALELFGKSKVLADFTATQEPIPIMATLGSPRPVRRYAANRIQVAVVAQHGMVDTNRFLENFLVVVHAKPVNAAVFENDFDAAVAWLANCWD